LTIAALVTEGIGSYGDVAHVITDGLDVGAAPSTNVIATILTEGFGMSAPASAFVVTEGFGSSSTRDALLRENQILERLLVLEKTKLAVRAIEARQAQIEREIKRVEYEEASMLLALFDDWRIDVSRTRTRQRRTSAIRQHGEGRSSRRFGSQGGQGSGRQGSCRQSREGRRG
jgi:hypothetical protein